MKVIEKAAISFVYNMQGSKQPPRAMEREKAHVQFILHFYACHSHNSHFRRYFVQTFYTTKKRAAQFPSKMI